MLLKREHSSRRPHSPCLLVILAALVLCAWPRSLRASEGEGTPHFLLLAVGGGYALSSGEGKGGNHFEGGGLLDVQMGLGWFHLGEGFGGMTGALDLRRRWTSNVVQDSSIDAGVLDYLFTLAAYWGVSKGSVVVFGSIGGSGMTFSGHQGEEINFTGGGGLGFLLPLAEWSRTSRGLLLFVEPRIGAFFHPTKNLGDFGFYDASLSLGMGF